MIRKTFFMAVCFLIINSAPLILGENFDFDAFCDCCGFTIIECTRAKFDTEVRDPDDPIELINGMIFMPLINVTYLGGSRVIILAAKAKGWQKEEVLYKLIIEYEPIPIDVYRVR